MVEHVAFALGFASLFAWVWLVFFRSRFWRADQRLAVSAPTEPADWPAVVAVIPARDEAPTIGRAVASILGSGYPGPMSVVVVDDESVDGTADAVGTFDRLTVVRGAPLERGWVGKVWAVHQGLAAAAETTPDARYVLLTDADIEHDPEELVSLVGKAETEGLHLASLMVRLNCRTVWERLLIPPFVFFFQKLYPFPRVNDPTRTEAAAAGGCMLVRRAALDASGGVAEIRAALIDDCALAARLKRAGPIWLGVARRTRSLRPYGRLGDVWAMVARTAFVQLNRSAFALAGAVVGMIVVYLGPPAGLVSAVIAGEIVPALAAAGAWALMAVAYRPTLGLYGQSSPAALLLPLAALLYTLITIDSARRYWLGGGGAWKGRSYGHGARRRRRRPG